MSSGSCTAAGTFDDYLAMAESCLNLAIEPMAVPAG